MSRGCILVIEDDVAIRQGLVDALDLEGYDAIEAADGAVGLEYALSAECDLILLDLMLPKRSGFEILDAVRESRPTLPVIILTARGEESDRVRGLKAGADDYVVKPFGRDELIARIEAVRRRSPERPSDVRTLRISGAVIDFDAREIRLESGEHRSMSERESDLVRYLAMHRGRAVSRDELMSRVWRLEPQGLMETRAVDMHIARLREKLNDAAPHAILRTVRGKGYMLVGEAAR